MTTRGRTVRVVRRFAESVSRRFIAVFAARQICTQETQVQHEDGEQGGGEAAEHMLQGNISSRNLLRGTSNNLAQTLRRNNVDCELHEVASLLNCDAPSDFSRRNGSVANGKASNHAAPGLVGDDLQWL